MLKELPRMRSLPGTYSPNEKKARQGLTLVDFESAQRAGVTLHGSTVMMERYVAETKDRQLKSYEARALKANGSRIRRPRMTHPFDGQSGNPLRFMAIVRLPHLHQVSRTLEYGFHCLGCENALYTREMHWRRKFNADSFTVHLSRCGIVTNGKHCVN